MWDALKRTKTIAAVPNEELERLGLTWLESWNNFIPVVKIFQVNFQVLIKCHDRFKNGGFFIPGVGHLFFTQNPQPAPVLISINLKVHTENHKKSNRSIMGANLFEI